MTDELAAPSATDAADAPGAARAPRPPPPELADAPMTPANAARIAASGLFFYACGLLAAALLASYGLMAGVAQAIIAEWGLSRLGVRWSSPTAASPSPASAPAARAARGFGLGVAAAALTTLLLLGSGAGHFERGGVVPATLAIGVLSAGASAVWSELFFRGLVLRLTEGVRLAPLRVVAAGLASSAATFTAPGATPLEAAVAGLFGALMAGLWLHDRGAFLACGAHAGWAFAARALFRGGLFELAGSNTLLGGYGAGPFSGGAAALVLVVALAAAGLYARRTSANGK